jgi:hypothetical protein
MVWVLSIWPKPTHQAARIGEFTAAQTSLDDINDSINDANKFIKEVADVKKVIAVAAAALDLATSLAEKNPKDIVNSAKELKDAMA